MEEAQGMLRDVWGLYAASPETMPEEYRKIAEKEGAKRAATDYVAGMTDRFARERWAEGAGKNFAENKKNPLTTPGRGLL
jgi:dGTP triphosphohydrolase